MTKIKQPAKTTKETPTSTKSTATKPEPIKTVAKTEVVKKPAQKADKASESVILKTPKIKMVRDSFTIPKNEYAQLEVLKERLIGLGQPAKKVSYYEQVSCNLQQ